jgi:Ni/Co efflux regulator RcnB
MKVRWWAAICAAAAIAAFSCSTAHAKVGLAAQEQHEHHWDKDHPQFDDHERGVVRDWWGTHRDRNVVGFRAEDRLPAAWESQLRVGFVLDNDWRRRTHPVPADLLAGLPPPPPHYRYYVIGGHVVLVDGGWHVVDILSVDF